MKERIVLLFTIFALCGFSLFAAGQSDADQATDAEKGEGGPIYGGTLNIVAPSDIKSFSPATLYGVQPGNFIFEQLAIGDITVTEDQWPFYGNVTPKKYWMGVVAESWEQPDISTAIFNIRKGIRFQNLPPVNGRELTAEDVVATYEWYASPESESDMAIIQTNVKSIKALDKYTVEFKLDPPSVEMWNGLTSERQFILPKELLEDPEQLLDVMNQIGTGPYIIKEYVPGSSFTYEKNPDYWGTDARHPGNKLPYIDKVKQLIVPDGATRLAGLRSGKFDALYIREWVGWRDAEDLMKTNSDLNFREIFFERAVHFGLRNDVKPFDNAKVRQAMSMAIDRQSIVDDYYGGHAYYPTVPFAKGWADLFTPLEELPANLQKVYEYDPEGAKQLLAEAGYADGFKAVLQVPPVGRVADYSNIAMLCQEWWADIGIEVEILTPEWGTFIGAIINHTYDNMTAWHMGINTALFSLGSYREIPGKTHMWNWSIVSDANYNEMYAKIATTFDDDARTELMREAGNYVKENVWHIDMPLSSFFIFWQPWLKGYWGQVGLTFYSTGDLIKYWWLDDSER